MRQGMPVDETLAVAEWDQWRTATRREAEGHEVVREALAVPVE